MPLLKNSLFLLLIINKNEKGSIKCCMQNPHEAYTLQSQSCVGGMCTNPIKLRRFSCMPPADYLESALYMAFLFQEDCSLASAEGC